MAQLLLINSVTKQDNNNIGDIVAIYHESKDVKGQEAINFDVVIIPGTEEEIKEQMNNLISENTNVDVKYLFRYENGEIICNG